jgi:hypothetical protein
MALLDIKIAKRITVTCTLERGSGGRSFSLTFDSAANH